MGYGRGKEPNHTTARKPGSLYCIKYSLDCTFSLVNDKSRTVVKKGKIKQVRIVDCVESCLESSIHSLTSGKDRLCPGLLSITITSSPAPSTSTLLFFSTIVKYGL
jgi:hypothetical protein